MAIKMILINKKSICIFAKSYDSQISSNPNLIGSFLSGVSIFAKEIGQDDINEILMANSKILYRVLDRTIELNIIIISDPDDASKDLRKLMIELGSIFVKNYDGEEIKSDIIKMDYFKTFEEYLDDLVPKKYLRTTDERIDKSKLLANIRKYDIDLKKVNLSFIVKKLKKELAKIIYALFIGSRVVVTGDSAMVGSVIDSLKIFLPNRFMKIIDWTENIVDTLADIVGLPPHLAGLFAIDSIIVDLDNNTVTGIAKNNYFQKLVKKIKNKTPLQCRALFLEDVEFLDKKIEQLLEIMEYAEAPIELIENFSKNINNDVLEILEKTLRINFPRSIENIEKNMANIQKIMIKKILL